MIRGGTTTLFGSTDGISCASRRKLGRQPNESCGSLVEIVEHYPRRQDSGRVSTIIKRTIAFQVWVTGKSQH